MQDKTNIDVGSSSDVQLDRVDMHMDLDIIQLACKYICKAKHKMSALINVVLKLPMHRKPADVVTWILCVCRKSGRFKNYRHPQNSGVAAYCQH